MNKEDKHFIEGYEKLLNKGYCNCNELNCIDNNSPRRILNIVKQLEEENKELKEKFLKQTAETYLRQIRIDKAIEYCDKTKEPYEEYYGKSFDEYDWVVDIARDLLEILKGDIDE